MHIRSLAASTLALLLAACGSASTTSGPGMMSVSLVDAPSPGYLEVNVDVQRVEIAGDSGWVTLGTPDRVVNLLALTGGVAETLVNGATLPAGHYGQMRLVLGSRNTVKLLDGSVHDLKVPSGQQSGVKMTVSFDVQPGTTSDVFVDFDAHRSIFVHVAGASGQYLLRPTVRAFDRMVTGSIAGTLRDATSGAGLPGVVVTAQTVGGAGPSIVRAVKTDAAGKYVLDLLPRDASYFAVSQPVILDSAGAPTLSYAPKASPAIAISATSPVGAWDASFSTATATGSVTGGVTPTAVSPEVDTVQARLALDAGGTSQTLIVRTVTATVDTTGETYAIPALPVSGASTVYGIVAERRSLDVSGTEIAVTSAPASATVPAGGSVSAGLSFP